MKKDRILEVNHLSTSFYSEKKEGVAVDDVSFYVNRGEILGIVGESGSGKSVTVMSVMRLIKGPKGVIKNGEILFNGEDLLKKNKKEMQSIRGKRISMIFQEPMTSLNPVITVGEQIAEVLRKHEKMNRKDAWNRTRELLEVVHIPLAEERMKEYPHQLSGGMRQRVMIAMALACNPDLLIADEPTTALDVTIQSQILELLKELQKKYNMSIILITHDMGVVAEYADRILVMYAGRVAESGTTEEILNDPKHPYTQALIEAIPKLTEEQEQLIPIPGNIPNIYRLPRGCNFCGRCRYADELCSTEKPKPVYTGERMVSCFYVIQNSGQNALNGPEGKNRNVVAGQDEEEAYE